MKIFSKSEDFKKLNIGFALDEGIACPHDALKVFYGERATWWIDVITRGNTGHGSQFIHETAVTKLVNKLRFFYFLKIKIKIIIIKFWIQ
jgi:aminoacylase